MTGASPAHPSPIERLARFAYTIVWWLATPAVAVYLWMRSRKQPAYRAHWGERFLGRYAGGPLDRCLWIHAVSVGETRATASIVAAIRAAWPRLTIVMTHMTPTGRETAQALYGDTVVHAYLAYDYPSALARFFAHFRPVAGLVMETEIWPNLMAAARKARVPMLLVNGRLSQKSLDGAMRWPSLMRPAARGFARILAQDDADAQRYAQLAGDDAPIVRVGNLKFDLDVPPTQRAIAARFASRLGRDGPSPRPVILCASTREGEEERIVDAWIRGGRGASSRPLLALVPRHPQRFDDVVAMARTRGLRVAKRSDDAPLPLDIDVWIGDSMGELFAYYLSADVAYIGGSIVPLGGQNLIEAAAVGCPILLGPHTFNFASASDEAVRIGAAIRVTDYDDLVRQALTLIDDAERRQAMAEAGIAFAQAHRGATERTLREVAAIVDSRTKDAFSSGRPA